MKLNHLIIIYRLIIILRQYLKCRNMNNVKDKGRLTC